MRLSIPSSIGGTIGALTQLSIAQQAALVTSEAYRGDVPVTLGKAFIGTDARAALAGQYSSIQLFNPAASGKVVLVDRIIATTQNAGPQLIQINADNAGLVQDDGLCQNLSMGGALSVSHMRSQQAGFPGTGFLYYLMQPGGGHIDIKFDVAHRLTAGFGLDIVPGVVNMPLYAVVLFREY